MESIFVSQVLLNIMFFKTIVIIVVMLILVKVHWLWLKVIKFSLIALIVNRLIQEINFQNAHTSKNFAFFVLVNWHWNVEIYFLNTKSNTQKKCPSKKSVNYCSNAIINFEKGTRILKLYIYIYIYIYIYMSFDILSFWIHHNGEMIVQRELNYFNEQNNLRE